MLKNRFRNNPVGELSPPSEKKFESVVWKREKTDQWNNPIIRISFQKWIELFLDVDFYKGDDDGVTE